MAFTWKQSLNQGEVDVLIIITVILFVFLYDFTAIRKQNNTIIKQNERVITLLEEIKNK
ncbi:hypothetical protein H8S33_18275 [Ornithinibacillus sp. BX22]|uniref:Uncharacterized protein n=1 Tax=Ornithinibacillus hominis TaxID=2763055 RepID=A0A923RKB2_9BACI|nr:hypothetical protein [Ornithinibacillus hominis]MBC5638721.1 hypothetical protein [Ornithinibacillus hominis]